MIYDLKYDAIMSYADVKKFLNTYGYDATFKALSALFPKQGLYSMSSFCLEHGDGYLWKAKGVGGDILIGWSESTGRDVTHQLTMKQYAVLTGPEGRYTGKLVISAPTIADAAEEAEKLVEPELIRLVVHIAQIQRQGA